VHDSLAFVSGSECERAQPSRKANPISGRRPETISASAFPEPAAIVHPSVPCPVLRYRLEYRVLPIRGTFDGVAGRRPVHQRARPASTAAPNHSTARRVSASQRTALSSRLYPASSAVPATRSRSPRRVNTIFLASSVTLIVGAPAASTIGSVAE